MKNITSKIEKYVNSQNRSLWEQLKSEYDISLYHDPSETSWLVKIKGKQAEIVCNELDYNHASFTHELLHIKLDQLGMTNFDELDDYLSNNLIFNDFFFRKFIYQIFNYHSHKKMYPYFNSMGFKDVDFVSKTESFSLYENFRLRLLPKIKILRTCGMLDYLGKYFALKNDFTKPDLRKKEKNLKRLRNINKELYDIADKFDTEWNERTDLNYLASLEYFSENLRPYLIKKYGR